MNARDDARLDTGPATAPPRELREPVRPNGTDTRSATARPREHLEAVRPKGTDARSETASQRGPA